jgi:hypothetical protein
MTERPLKTAQEITYDNMSVKPKPGQRVRITYEAE